MDESQFWSILASSDPGDLDDQDRQLAVIRQGLAKLPPEQVREFDRIFDRKMAEAYDWTLWGAAYLINGGCSDDGFAYFRAWLISRGREVFEAALRDPDSLAGLTDPERDDYEFEELWYTARQVYEEQTGVEMPPRESVEPAEPGGQDWDFDDDKAMAKKLPRLAEIYLG